MIETWHSLRAQRHKLRLTTRPDARADRVEAEVGREDVVQANAQRQPNNIGRGEAIGAAGWPASGGGGANDR